ncbi:helix-turn-helix transcriptional regulator [Microbacterium sp. zg-YB36]|uniref:helix-turn-helix transcriptional regulator n=1 Tax=Microbacterium sp. zg-YB36 TaxID=2969407 RepID=UPI00214BFE05|nr:helix-turn-helix transcriptional regulator [Microbacterium sp. zg-YB36]MDL5351413.1 helix-turn-helix transcriptional regulator [Microbacterium sp. zg-YB36]
MPLLENDPDLRHDPRRQSWLLLAPLFLRDDTDGARLRALADEVRGAAGVGDLPAVLFHLARDQATTAGWAHAEATYSEAIHLAADTGQDTERAMSLAGLAGLESRAGKADACRAHAGQAAQLCLARDIHMGRVWVLYALGDLELSLGNAELAVAHFTDLAALLAGLGLQDADLDPAPELTDALLRLGRRAEAESVAARFLAAARRKGQPWSLARAHRGTALAASDDRFERSFDAALVRHDQTLDRFETARTRLAFGERLRRAGRRVDARVQLRAALAEFGDLGAQVWRAQAAAELTATGERVQQPQAPALSALTPQELQVSVLLADGRTTREAAAALFLSPKTVEYHLRKVYTKLGIGSRAQLAEAIEPAK